MTALKEKVSHFIDFHIFHITGNIYNIHNYIRKLKQMVLYGWKNSIGNGDNKYFIAISYKQSLTLRVKTILLV